MIRRAVDATDQQGDCLGFLIEQADHARLAADIASHWVGLTEDGPIAADTVETIRRHDDGWLDWDSHPQVAPDTFVPIDFTEMPIQDALEIHSDCIHRVQDLGELAQYMVAQHFIRLHDFSSKPRGRQVLAWMEEFRGLSGQWLNSWKELNATAHTATLAECNARQLQFFDYLSIWLCCRPRHEPVRLSDWNDRVYHLRPQASARSIAIDPWPFQQTHLEITVAGWRLPSEYFADDTQLHEMLFDRATLRWKLLPLERESGQAAAP